MKAMNEIGTQVLIGFAPTKILSILVLAFAPAIAFRIYFFRMYMIGIFLGIFNGLFFLPIILGWIGPPPDQIAIIDKNAGKNQMHKLIMAAHRDS